MNRGADFVQHLVQSPLAPEQGTGPHTDQSNCPLLDRRTAPISNAIIPKEQQLLTYQDAINQLSNGEKASLLIANGFSQAWDAQIFNYANILDAASFGDRDKKIKKLFSLSNTYDFESIMNQLVSAQIVLENYGGDPNLIQEIKDDQEILKEALVKAIAKTHPSIPNKITDNQFVAVRKFFINIWKYIFFELRSITVLGNK